MGEQKKQESGLVCWSILLTNPGGVAPTASTSLSILIPDKYVAALLFPFFSL